MVEFKHSRRTGAWALMEINSRFWGSLPLSLAAGVDFPRYLYEMVCEGRTGVSESLPRGDLRARTGRWTCTGSKRT